jgi:hypothetical protein
MNAFVKTVNGEFPNANFYHAWKGWTEMGYTVHKFEESELDGTEIWKWLTRDTPVFTGVKTYDRILKKLDVDYWKTSTYPRNLRPFLATEINDTKLGKVRENFSQMGISVFVKPVEQKVFTGLVLKTCLDLIPISDIPDDCDVFTGYPCEFLSEYRVYVHNGDIVGVKHYRGDWTLTPDIGVIKDAVGSYFDTPYWMKPCSYALDFGVVRKKQGNITALVEFNDATSLGNYGIHQTKFAEMHTARWFEIIKNSEKERLFKLRDRDRIITQEQFIERYKKL